MPSSYECAAWMQGRSVSVTYPDQGVEMVLRGPWTKTSPENHRYHQLCPNGKKNNFHGLVPTLNGSQDGRIKNCLLLTTIYKPAIQLPNQPKGLERPNPQARFAGHAGH